MQWVSLFSLFLKTKNLVKSLCSRRCDFGVVSVDITIVFFLVKEVSITDVLVWVVTCERLWGHLLVRVTEVDVAHVISVMEEIGVKSIVVPEVVLVVLAFPMPIDHVVQESAHSCEHVGPKDRSDEVEPRVSRSHDLVVRMG